VRALAALALGLWLAFGGPAQAEPLRFQTVASSDGVPINVVEAGVRGKPAIVLIHGFSQSYMAWLPQLTDPELTARYHLIALDLRGHGASGKPWRARDYASYRLWAGDVQAALTATGAVRPVLIGWSFGGYAVMDYVRARGVKDIAGVMFVGSHGGLLPRPPANPPQITNDLEVQRKAARDFMALMSAAPQTPEAVARGEDAFLMLPPYARRAFAGRNLDNRDIASRLALPVRIVVGEKDPTVSAEGLATLARTLPHGAEATILPGVGHSPFAERTSDFNALLAAFRDAHP
jgi:non-heme chloroperoxidase